MEEPVYVPEWEDIYSGKVENADKLGELIKIHDESFDEEGNILDRSAYWDSKRQIRNILEVPSRDDVNDALDALIRRIERLEKELRNHRHRMDVSYSGRAEL